VPKTAEPFFTFIQNNTSKAMTIKVLLLTVATATTFATCKNAQEKTTATAPTGTTAAAAAPAAAAPQPAKAGGLTPISLEKYPKPSASRAAFMSTGIWKLGGAVSPSDDGIMSTFQVTDIKFGADGTFKAMKGADTVGSGTWTFNDENSMLYLSSPVARLNTSYMTKENGFRMVWMGNTDLNGTGDQIMWNCIK
jgi:hypothetical protein